MSPPATMPSPWLCSNGRDCALYCGIVTERLECESCHQATERSANLRLVSQCPDSQIRPETNVTYLTMWRVFRVPFCKPSTAPFADPFAVPFAVIFGGNRRPRLSPCVGTWALSCVLVPEISEDETCL